MKMRKIFQGLLIIAALLFIVSNAGDIAGIFGSIGDLVVAVAVAVLAAFFILFVLLPLLGVIFVGMSLFILLLLLAGALSVPFALMQGYRPHIAIFTGSEVRSLPAFDTIRVAGDMDLLVVAGGGHAVALKGNMSEIRGMTTEVKDNQLVISESSKPSFGSDIRVAVNAGDLKAFHVDGAVHAALRRLDSEALDLDMSGASKIEASGQCGKAVIHLSGVGSLDAHDLKCDEVDITVDGAGNAKVYAAKHLNVKISGLGHVTYGGQPAKVERSITGLGNLSAE